MRTQTKKSGDVNEIARYIDNYTDQMTACVQKLLDCGRKLKNTPLKQRFQA
jgi:hypothetical protein